MSNSASAKKENIETLSIISETTTTTTTILEIVKYCAPIKVDSSRAEQFCLLHLLYYLLMIPLAAKTFLSSRAVRIPARYAPFFKGRLKKRHRKSR